eukprot:m.147595 g.147595  ORF g.147595 m.147595 type:complete len:268 (-) comp30547_c1_seq1:53-856(-)
METPKLSHHEQEESLKHLSEINAIKDYSSRKYTVHCTSLRDVSNLESKNDCVKTINVHFVRHGEGEHNVLAKQLGYAAYRDPKVTDAKLTPLGEQQATTLQQVFTTLEEQALDLIAVSPLRRTLQTATLATQLVSERVPRVAFETLREQIGQNICDKRRSVSIASAEFPLVDFANIVEHDPLWTETREEKSAMAERAYAFVESLVEQERVRDVAVFSHSSYLFTMFNAAGVFKICEKNPHNTALRTWFATGELRSVRLDYCINNDEQ